MTSPLAASSVTWTRRQIARVTRNSLIAHGISLTFVALILWASSTYLWYFFTGPIRPTDAELLALIEAGGDRSLISYVELHDRELLETGWQEVTTSDGKPYSTIPFYLAPVGDRYLLVLARSAADGRRLVGPLSPLRGMDQEVVDATVRRHPELAGKVLPAQMSSVAAFTVWGYVLLVVLVPWGGWSAARFARSLLCRLAPDSHPLTARFAAREGRASLDDEMASDLVLQLGKAIVTESWLVRPTLFDVQGERVDDVVWAYEVRQSSECFLVLGLRSGRLRALSLKSEAIQRTLDFLSRRSPWLLIGFDADRHRSWRKIYPELVREVDARRAAS